MMLDAHSESKCVTLWLLLVELFQELSNCFVATFPLFTPLRFLVYEQQKQIVSICCKLKPLITINMSVLQHLSALHILSLENKNSRKFRQQWHWRFVCLCSKRCNIRASKISDCSFPLKEIAFAVANSKLYIHHCQHKCQSVCMDRSYLHKIILSLLNSKMAKQALFVSLQWKVCCWTQRWSCRNALKNSSAQRGVFYHLVKLDCCVRVF